MDLFSRLTEFAETKVEEPIMSFTIAESEASIWDTSDMDAPFVMTIRYEDDDRTGLGREIVSVPDSGLNQMLDSLFDELNANVTSNLSDVSVESPSVSFEVDSSYFDGDTDGTVPDIDNSVDSQVVAARRVTRIRDQLSEEFTELTDMVIEEVVDRFSDNIAKSDLIELEFYFDDFRVCELCGVRAYAATENPHLYYEGVSSVEEFLAEVSDPDMTEDGLYEIFFRLDYGEDGIDSSYIPNRIVNRAESVMNDRMESYVDVKGECAYEAEGILLEDGEERTYFYLRQDADDIAENIGET